MNCKICKKEFNYGDKNSPMLKNLVWNRIVSFYKLTNYEKEASHRFHTKWHKGIHDFIPNDHLFLCYECMEKALGRKLTKEDLINCPLNEQFIKEYFNE